MARIRIGIIDGKENLLAEKSGEDEVNLVYLAGYQEGDAILVEVSETEQFYFLCLDDGKGKSLVYLTGNIRYEIPFGEKRFNISPKAFWGERHLLSVRKARPFEVAGYRNLAVNVWDQHGAVNCYPHASANVETRGESVFAAMNAIDGVTASESHGLWPYASWGINRRDDACLRVEFGREVEIDRLILYTRADFPHDNWWEKGRAAFSDGSSLELKLEKGGAAQEFLFEKKRVCWLELKDLIKADDPSPFPALVQLEAYGRETQG